MSGLNTAGMKVFLKTYLEDGMYCLCPIFFVKVCFVWLLLLLLLNLKTKSSLTNKSTKIISSQNYVM